MKMLYNLWKNRRRETMLGGLFALLAIISLIVNYGTIGRKTSHIVGGVSSLKNELEEKQQAFSELKQQIHSLQKPLNKLSAEKSKFHFRENNSPQKQLRNKIERAAKSVGLRLKAIGTMQNIKIADGLNTYEINITADAQLPIIIDFMQKIKAEKPHIGWKNITVTPDNMRSPNYLMLNGTLKIIVLDDEEMIEKLWGEK